MIVVFLFVLLFITLLSPEVISLGVYNAFSLTTEVLLPALLPGMIIAQLLVKKIDSIHLPLIPDRYNDFFVLTILCFFTGIPSSALIINNYFHQSGTSNSDNSYLRAMLILTSNPSLSFVCNYVMANFNNVNKKIIFICFITSPVLNFIVYIFLKKINISDFQHNKFKKTNTHACNSFVETILKCVKTMALIFVYLSMASILEMIIYTLINNALFTCFLSSLLEITSSCHNSLQLISGINQLYFLIFSISFCGLSGILQIYSVINDYKISILFLIKIKILNAITALSILNIYLLFN